MPSTRAPYRWARASFLRPPRGRFHRDRRAVQSARAHRPRTPPFARLRRRRAFTRSSVSVRIHVRVSTATRCNLACRDRRRGPRRRRRGRLRVLWVPPPGPKRMLATMRASPARSRHDTGIAIKTRSAWRTPRSRLILEREEDRQGAKGHEDDEENESPSAAPLAPCRSQVEGANLLQFSRIRSIFSTHDTPPTASGCGDTSCIDGVGAASSALGERVSWTCLRGASVYESGARAAT